MHMRTLETQTQKALDLAKRRGILRTRDIREAGLHHETLRRLCDTGLLEKVGRGLYTLTDAEITLFHDLAVAAVKAPEGVVCLLSALAFHEITTQLPHSVWMAFPRKVRTPRLGHPRLRVVRFSDPAMSEGIATHQVDNVSVRITNVPKTIADCFKFRNKIGLEAALESLKDGLKQKKCTRDEIWHYAKINRVARVIKPYLEATA